MDNYVEHQVYKLNPSCSLCTVPCVYSQPAAIPIYIPLNRLKGMVVALINDSQKQLILYVFQYNIGLLIYNGIILCT